MSKLLNSMILDDKRTHGKNTTVKRLQAALTCMHAEATSAFGGLGKRKKPHANVKRAENHGSRPAIALVHHSITETNTDGMMLDAVFLLEHGIGLYLSNKKAA